MLTADGFNDLGVRDAARRDTVARATLLALPSTRQIVASVPEDGVRRAGLAGARYVVAMRQPRRRRRGHRPHPARSTTAPTGSPRPAPA